MLSAWDLADPQPLPGGQREAFRCGPFVLKPVDDPAQAVWLAEVLNRLDAGAALRVVRPARSLDGRWIVDGWAAWYWMAGEHRPDAWDDVLDVSERFHQVVSGVEWSAAMVTSNRWADADRVAWADTDGEPLPPQARPLLARRRPVDLPSQLIHGDLGGNVLFHDSLPPAVIDVSPYWRPAGYATAIVVADAVAWGGAGDDLVERLLREQGDQLLMRAVLFRVATDPSEAHAYQRVIALLDGERNRSQ